MALQAERQAGKPRPSLWDRANATLVPVVFLSISVWICLEARQVPFEGFRMPSAGFFPLLLGLTLGLLSLILLAMNLYSGPGGVAPQVEAGKIRLLAVTSGERHPAFPEVPTLRELGYDVTHAIWHAVSVPAGTAPAVVATLRRGLQAMVGDEGFKAALQKLGERPQYLDSEALEQFLAQDYQKVGAVLRQIIQK
jgi:hypothetical protein